MFCFLRANSPTLRQSGPQKYQLRITVAGKKNWQELRYMANETLEGTVSLCLVEDKHLKEPDKASLAGNLFLL